MGLKEGGRGGKKGGRWGGVAERKSRGDGVHAPLAGIDASVIEELRGQVAEWGVRRGKWRPVVIVEGFLLFGKSMWGPGAEVDIGGLFDARVLLRARREDAGRRRGGREGYVTLNGFWRDPEGYFEGCVWPGYVREYGGFLGRGEEEGRGGEVVGGVWCSDVGWGLEECLRWVVGVVMGEVERGEG